MEFNPRNVRHNIGDKVVALMDFGGLVAGKTYTVEDVTYCPKCGGQSVHVGLYGIGDPYTIETCYCGYSYRCQVPNLREEKGSFRFAPLQEIDNLMASAIEEENYELAQILKEINP